MGWRTRVAGAGLLLSLWIPAVVQGQLYGPDPYNGTGDYNAGFIPYTVPVYPNGSMYVPGQGNLAGPAGLRRANQYQKFIEDLDGVGTGESGLYGGPSRRGRGTSPYRTERPDQYVPNRAADAAFNKLQEDRSRVYFEAMREQNPQKRARLLEQYNRLSRDLARETGPRRGGVARVTPPDQPVTSPSRRPSNTPAPRTNTAPRSGAATQPSTSQPNSNAGQALAPGASVTRTPRPAPGTSRTIRPRPQPPAGFSGLDEDLTGEGRTPGSSAGSLLPSDVLERSDRFERRRTPRMVPVPPRAPRLPGTPPSTTTP
jgi:hypothetical protein